MQVEELAGSGAWDTAGLFPSARPCALALNYLAQRPAPLAGHCVVSPCPAGYTALALLAPLLAAWHSREPGLSRLGRQGTTAPLNWGGARERALREMLGALCLLSRVCKSPEVGLCLGNAGCTLHWR